MKKPVIAPDALYAANAAICGDVTIEAGVSIWFHSTIRAENVPAVIGKNSNIQDNCVLHVDNGCPLTIGEGVSVGHGAILHGCTIGDDTVVGMGAIGFNPLAEDQSQLRGHQCGGAAGQGGLRPALLSAAHRPAQK